MRNQAYRRFKRFVKGMRRIKEDRQQHGNDRSCECFSVDAEQGKGKTFARFADTPKNCSCTMCGSPRKWAKGKEALTRQEMRANETHSN